MKLGRRIAAGALATVTAFAGLALIPASPAGAVASGNPIIRNSGSGGGVSNVVESDAISDDTDDGNRNVTLTFLVDHVRNRHVNLVEVTGGFNGTQNLNVTSERLPGPNPNTNNGLETSRVTVTFDPGHEGDIDCVDPFGDGPTRRPSRTFNFRVRDSASAFSSTVSHSIQQVETDQCTGGDDFAEMHEQTQNLFDVVPGQDVTFTFKADDADITGTNDHFDKYRYRKRRLNDGFVSSVIEVNPGGDNDNDLITLVEDFPTRGRWVIEAELASEDSYENAGNWFRIGAVDVNDAAAPTGTLGFTATGGSVFASTPPSVNAGADLDAVVSSPVDSSAGTTPAPDGEVQVVEWDQTNDGTFERMEYTVPTGPPVAHTTVTTAELTQDLGVPAAGNYSVRARLTDNGAMDAADNNRRQTTLTQSYRVNAIPTAVSRTGANAININEDSGPVGITLQGNDADNQPRALAFELLTSPPAAAGTLNCTLIPSCTFTPASNFNGSTSFTFRTNDGPVTTGPNNGQAWSNSATATVTINVAAVNDAPTANSQTVDVTEDTVTNFTVTGSDVAGEPGPLQFFVQTQPPSGHGTVSCATNGNCSYSPGSNFNGTTNFVFRVQDGGSPVLSSTATVTFEVAAVNDAPVALDQSFNIGEDAGPQNFTLLGSDPADGDAVTFSATAPPASEGTLACAGSACTFTPADDFNGTSTVAFTVTDDDVVPLSDSGTVTFNVAPVNDPPEAIGQSVTTDEDTEVDITLGADDIDTPLAGLDFTAPVGSNGPDHGTVTELADPVFTYDPADDYFGGDQFDFSVSDGEFSDTNTVVLTINPVNDAPTVASPQSFTTDEDTPRIITVEASDIDGDALDFTVLDGPDHGALSGALPDVGYSPFLNFNGSDSFTIEVSDGNGGLTQATINLTVNPVNDRPVATATNVTTPEDIETSFLLEGFDVDTGDVLTYTVLTSPTTTPLGTLDCTAAPACSYDPASDANGSDQFIFEVNDGQSFDTAAVTITITPVNDPPETAPVFSETSEEEPVTIEVPWSDPDSVVTFSAGPAGHGSVSGAGPSFLYTPEQDFNGFDNFEVTVSDGVLSDVSLVTILVTAVNDAPAANAVSTSTTEDQSVEFDLSATDVDDPPGDLTFDPGTPPSGTGSVSCTGSACEFDPAADFNGLVQWTYTVTDDSGASASALITIAVATDNDAPTVVGPATVVTDEDIAASITLEGHDIDGDELTYAVLTLPAHGALLGDAPNLTYTPAQNYSGGDSIEWEVTDGNGGSATATVAITVTPVNDAPEAQARTVAAVEDTAVTFTVAANDVEGDPITYAVAAPPSFGGVTCTAAGSCTYTPAADFNGHDSFTFSASDPAGASTTAVVTIAVAPAPLIETRIEAFDVLLSVPVLRARLTRVDTGAPVVGRTLTFVAGGQVQCSAVTDANGIAQCGGILTTLVAVVGLGYDAHFAGDHDYLPSSDRGALISVSIRIRLL